MFESAELGHKVDKATYAIRAPQIREALLGAQFDFVDAKKFATAIVIGGVDGAGKGETVNLLSEWMDPRHIHTHAMGEPSDDEKQRPAMWRFWRSLPPKGKIGIFFGSWYTSPILGRVKRKIGNAEFDAQLEEVVRFERMLADEGVLLLKFWFHLSKEQQETRLKALEKNADTRWRVISADWKHFRLYNRFRKVSERALRETSRAEAPWTVVEGACSRYRSLTVAHAIHDALRSRLDAAGPPDPAIRAAPGTPPAIDRIDVLSKLDLTRSVDKDAYAGRLEALQGKLNLLTRHDNFRKRSVVLVFEGADAAGKGGAIRRVTAALDARQYRVIPIAAPSDEERAQPYLWRFWRNVPRRGMFAIFDRSWYGRVLVERVEGFCRHADWMRAYAEINDFEEQLVTHDVVIVKFWLQIDADEQLRRFDERKTTAFKRYKITPEDLRNRAKWDAYQRAMVEVVDRTSSDIAPWKLVEANDKYYARLTILQTICERLEGAR